MLGMNRKLASIRHEGKAINVGLVGAGQMGRGMVSQIEGMKGMKVVAVADINIDHVFSAYISAGKSEHDIVKVKDLSSANTAIAKSKVIATTNSSIITTIPDIDVVVDATGIPNIGANIALQSILNNKHIVMLNVETDVTVGPILKKMADAAN